MSDVNQIKWKKITKELPFGHYLVTTNIAMAAYGGFFWHTREVFRTDGPEGPFSAFVWGSDARVCGAKYYVDLASLTRKE